MNFRFLGPLCLVVLGLASSCGGSASDSGGGDGDGDAGGAGDGDGRGGGEGGGDGDGDAVSTFCDPGATQDCRGLSEGSVCDGVQICSGNGMSWGDCECPPGGGGQGSGGTSNGSGGESPGTGGLPDATGGASEGGDGGEGGAGGAGGADPTHPDAVFVTEGLGESGAWRGYLWAIAETGSSITPQDFTTSNLCVSGTLGAAFEEWAMIGWNIAQEIDPETLQGGEINSISPGGTGLRVVLTNPGGTGLRAQIQTDETGFDSYCAEVPEGGGTIPWGSFKKECWPGGAMAPAYDGTTPIAQVGIQTYAPTDDEVSPFEYCVVDLGPAN